MLILVSCTRSDESAVPATTTTATTPTTAATTTAQSETTTDPETTAESSTTSTAVASSTITTEDETATTEPEVSCVGDLPASPQEEDGYRRMELCGWQVFMHNDLYADPLAAEVYRELAEDMRTVVAAVPTPAVQFLQDTKIWLELDQDAFPGGVYHPSAQWLTENGYPPKWAKGIQFGVAQNFLDWPDQQPAMLLHELTHALHDQQYDFGDPDILAVYDQAMAAGLYDSVEYVTGGFQVGYATTNQQEYLAEITEAYFWTNDFYPFDRQDLTAHDPAGLALVERVWKLD